MAEIKRAIALGFFDGVHLGHGELLKKTNERAAQIGAVPSVLSFDVHPDTLVFNREVPLINSAISRKEIIKRCYGIDNVVFIHFNRRVMQMPWREFIDNLVQELNIGWIVVGHDFCFGHKGEGTTARLKDYCLEKSIGFDVIPALTIDGVVVSSTYIRELLANGDIEKANRLLSSNYSLLSCVVHGKELGRKLGIPTINQFSEGKELILKNGIYCTKCTIDGESYYGVTNVGIRPTVDATDQKNIETHLIGYDGDCYDKLVKVEFLSRLRDEIKFDSVDELRLQIQKDLINTKKYFKV